MSFPLRMKNWFLKKMADWGFVLAPASAPEMRRQFKTFGKSWLREPLGTIKHPECISIGDSVEIEPGVDFELNREYPLSGQKFTPELIIEDGVCIRRGTVVYCNDKVTIRKNVLIGRNAVICDVSHEYQDIERSIGSQPVVSCAVEIGEDSFIGHGAMILPGVRIGKHCVIGAGAVVCRDIPDFCIAAGNPAQIVKSYDRDSKSWAKGKPM